jgi:hypothetical protein
MMLEDSRHSALRATPKPTHLGEAAQLGEAPNGLQRDDNRPSRGVRVALSGRSGMCEATDIGTWGCEKDMF